MRFVEPAIVCSQFHLREGDVVADFGAGGGYFLAPLTQVVGAEGTVYALEVQKSLIESLSEIVRQKDYPNVQVLWADFEEPGGSTLEADVLDTAIMVNTLFQLTDKADALGEVFRTLRSGGKFFIIDWSESFGNLGPTPEAVVPEADAQALAEETGFVLERTFAAGEHHYGLALRKP